jgi:hypothetical protein
MGIRGGLRMKAVVIVAVLIALAGCSERAPILFDGESFKSKSKAVSDDNRTFTVETRDAAGREEAAVKAARYEATLYCMNQFGTSDMVWTAESDDIVLTEDGKLVREGQCASR